MLATAVIVDVVARAIGIRLTNVVLDTVMIAKAALLDVTRSACDAGAAAPLAASSRRIFLGRAAHQPQISSVATCGRPHMCSSPPARMPRSQGGHLDRAAIDVFDDQRP